MVATIREVLRRGLEFAVAWSDGVLRIFLKIDLMKRALSNVTPTHPRFLFRSSVCVSPCGSFFFNRSARFLYE
jgi:hypothetical protein